MAPFPEEVDVFSGPHSKMKNLVDCYLKMLPSTDFSNEEATDTFLRNLHSTFCVFRSHEQIENDYIMYRLRSRLETLAVADPHDSVVCNCHSDNRLSDILRMVRDGLERRTTSSMADRVRYGRQLEQALEDFTCSFLPHMKEEEEVFQPLLVKYFKYDELVSLKETVTEQHDRLESGDAEKFCLETIRDADAKPDFDDPVIARPNHFERLPLEIVLKVFSYLWPPDLGRCAKVCSTWNDLAYHPSLWSCIVPTHWAKGVWQSPYDTYYPECYVGLAASAQPCTKCGRDDDEDDEDADNSDDDWQTEFDDPGSPTTDVTSMKSCLKSLREVRRRERIILYSLLHFVLPRVGINVRRMLFAGCGSLNGKQLVAMLSHCPNVNHLNLSYTHINYEKTSVVAIDDFADEEEHQLMPRPVHLDLSGCSQLTDDGFEWLVDHLINSSELEHLDLSGCFRITDAGIGLLLGGNSGLPSLRHLDLSGCWNLSGAALTTLIRHCSSLSPENLYYCDHIMDGPHPDACNGCQNLECLVRSCCCT